MEIQKSTGIILSSRLFREADILSNILTKEYGKRKFIFKGLNKSKKRAQSAKEPGTILRIVYYFNESRDSYIVNEFDVKKYYFNIRENLEKIYNQYFILEVVEKTTGYNDTMQNVFNLLIAGIDTLSKTDYPNVHNSS